MKRVSKMEEKEVFDAKRSMTWKEGGDWLDCTVHTFQAVPVLRAAVFEHQRDSEILYLVAWCIEHWIEKELPKGDIPDEEIEKNED